MRWKPLFFSLIILFLLAAGRVQSHAQQATGWYNTDSLLHHLSKNKKIKQVLLTADAIYRHAHIDSVNISQQAFKVAYLEKWMVDHKQFHIKGQLYKKKHILTVVDYTRLSNSRRFITVDLQRRRILYDTLVTQGSGTGGKKNDKYCLPVYFSNENNSLCSSLGLTIATKGTHPDNPCHLCRYTFTRKHDCVIVMEGLEKGINDNILPRDIVVHTTGSLSFGADSLREKLKIKDINYRVVPESCECCSTAADSAIKGTSLYASTCGIAENGGYIGQSNGCLVLPEDYHIEIMRTIKGGSLIFIYSNVISEGTNYFRDSPVIKKVVRMIGVR